MLNLCCEPATRLSGTLYFPGDKSISHRALILSGLAEGNSFIQNLAWGEDCLATLAILRTMGVSIDYQFSAGKLSQCQVQGVGLKGLKPPKHRALSCGNSGTSMRLFCGLLSAQPFSTTLVGDVSLSRRPMERVALPLRTMGAHIKTSAQGTAPIKIEPVSALKPIRYDLSVPSAQVKSAILLAALYARGSTDIFEPVLTRDHTENLLQYLQYPLVRNSHCTQITGEQTLIARDIDIPGDLSSAAFFIVAASVAPDANLLLRDVGINPTRSGIIYLLQKMGAQIECLNQRFFGNERVADLQVKSSSLSGIEIMAQDVAAAVDELPVLMVAAAVAKGQTYLRGAAELRYKESDRIKSMVLGLQALGVEVEELPDGMVIRGGRLSGGVVDSFADHRIAMAFAVAAGCADKPITILNAENIATSFPNFIACCEQVGFKITKRRE